MGAHDYTLAYLAAIGVAASVGAVIVAKAMRPKRQRFREDADYAQAKALEAAAEERERTIIRLRNRVRWLNQIVTTGRHPDKGTFVARGPYRVQLVEAQRQLDAMLAGAN